MKKYMKACVTEDYFRNIRILIRTWELPAGISSNMKILLQKYYVLQIVWSCEGRSLLWMKLFTRNNKF
jgi:hypothetical protein